MPGISVVIITYNEEKNLERCLGSVAGLADEIIVVDSNSTDRTPDIALAHGAHLYNHAFEGYARQKNLAISYASNDWVLSLDADEALPDDLKENIRAMKNSQPEFDVYRMARITNYCGKWIRHCGWYPDYQTRFFDKTKGHWEERLVHEFWKPDNETSPYGVLKGDLLHYSFTSVESHKQKIEKYTDLAAREAVRTGRSAGLLKVIFSPIWHFISEYFFKLGFMDGKYGFTICRLSAFSAYLKYSKIRRATRTT